MKPITNMQRAAPQPDQQALELEQKILRKIPMLKAMNLTFDQYDGETLQLSAPLDANINDKGTAFGGSLATLATITGWCYTTLLAEHVGDNEVVVADSQLRYLKPLKGRLVSHCSLSDLTVKEKFITDLNNKNRASLQLEVTIGRGSPVLQFSGRYVASLKEQV